MPTTTAEVEVAVVPVVAVPFEDEPVVVAAAELAVETPVAAAVEADEDAEDDDES